MLLMAGFFVLWKILKKIDDPEGEGDGSNGNEGPKRRKDGSERVKTPGFGSKDRGSPQMTYLGGGNDAGSPFQEQSETFMAGERHGAALSMLSIADAGSPRALLEQAARRRVRTPSS
jgi:hypothetical protein